MNIISLPASGDVCRWLITFANSLDPDQARQDVGPDLDANNLTPWWYSWKNLRKSWFLKNLQTIKKWKITQHAQTYYGQLIAAVVTPSCSQPLIRYYPSCVSYPRNSIQTFKWALLFLFFLLFPTFLICSYFSLLFLENALLSLLFHSKISFKRKNPEIFPRSLGF